MSVCDACLDLRDSIRAWINEFIITPAPMKTTQQQGTFADAAADSIDRDNVKRKRDQHMKAKESKREKTIKKEKKTKTRKSSKSDESDSGTESVESGTDTEVPGVEGLRRIAYILGVGPVFWKSVNDKNDESELRRKIVGLGRIDALSIKEAKRWKKDKDRENELKDLQSTNIIEEGRKRRARTNDGFMEFLS